MKDNPKPLLYTQKDVIQALQELVKAQSKRIEQLKETVSLHEQIEVELRKQIELLKK